MSRNPIKRKLFATKAASIDEATRSVSFAISTNDKDRYGDVVDQESWDFKSFLKNPIVLWGHDPYEPENVLGTAKDLQVSEDGSETTATLTFDSDINPKAGLIFEQIKRGTLRTVSVGFRNHTLEYDEDTPILKDNELLEISVVPIPANAGALAKEFKAGAFTRKDAKYLLDSMRHESAELEELLKAAPQHNDKEKNMTDEQAQALIDGVAKLTEKVEAQATEIAALKEAATPPAETDEDKAAREAKEQEDANVAAGLNPDGTAKGGSDDQPGASDDEFDEDAELTPEREAELDAQQAELLAELEPAA